MAIPAAEFELGALAAVENAPDINTGYSWLTEEYQSSEWDNPTQAGALLSQYGTILRQKFNSNNVAGLGDISQELPYSLEELPDASIEDEEERRIEKVNLWEEANLKYLDVATEPNLLLKRDLLKKYVPASASLQRRVIKDPGVIRDTAARVALGIVSPVTTLFGSPEPEFLKENTNPERDDDFLSELITGAGTVGTAIAVTAGTGGLGAAAYLGAGAVGSVKETYEDTKETTGDTDRALAAAGVDAAGQTVGFALGGRVATKLGTKLALATKTALGASTKAIAEGATPQAASSVFKSIMVSAGQQGVGNAAMTAGKLGAQRVGTEGEEIEFSRALPTGEDVEPLLRSAAVGGILGAGASGITESYAGLAQRIQARRAAQLDQPPSETAAPESGVPPTQPETPEQNMNNPGGLLTGALEGMSAELPKIDLDGVAHAQEAQSVFIAPTTREQARSPEEASQTLTGVNGDTYHVYGDGETIQSKTADGQLAPADKTFFVDKDTATVLAALKAARSVDGETPKIYTDGEDLLVKSDYVTEDLDLANVPTGQRFARVPVKDGPAVGDVPVSATIPLAGGEKTQYASNIGPSIAEIAANPRLVESAAQTGAEGPEGKPRMLAQRVVDNEALPQGVRDAFLTYDKNGERTTSLRYLPQSRVETGNQGLEWIAGAGGEEAALHRLLTGPKDISREQVAAATELFRSLTQGVAEAERAGDPVASMQLTNLSSALLNKFAPVGTEAGQIVDFFKEFKNLTPEQSTAFKLGTLRGKIFEEEIGRQGLTADEVAREPSRLTQIDEQIAQAEAAAPKPAEGEKPKKNPEVEKLLRQREQLKARIDKRTERVEARLNKSFPPEMREQYQKLLELRRNLPEGTARANVDREISVIESRLDKSVLQRLLSNWDSFYINNLLADIGTGIATAVGNVENLAVASAGVVLGGPFRGGRVSEIPQNFQEFSRIALQSFPKATRNAFSAFMGNYFAKYNEGDFVKTGPPGLRYIGYVGRFLSALDVFAKELGTDAATAIRIMEMHPEARNLKGEERRAFLSEALFGNETLRTNAVNEAQRQVELMKEANLPIPKGTEQVIVDDILRRARPENIREEVEGWAKKIALQNDQGGTLGIISKSMNNLRKVPFAGPAFVNFVRAAGNLIAWKLESTPYGFIRPTLLKQFHGIELTPLERSTMYTQAILGSSIAAGAYGLMQSGYFTVHGNGPRNPDERRRWLDSGGKPFSVELDGKYISYAETPFASMLAAIGGYGDYQKFSVAKNKISEKQAANYIMGASMTSLFANPLLQTSAEFLSILQDANQGGNVADRLSRFFTKNSLEAVRNATIPLNRSLRNVSAMWQDPLETRLSWQAAILNGIPFAGGASAGQPALNVFGQPILEGKSASERFRSISRFYTQQVNDPALRFLSDKGYYVTDLDSKVTIPDKGLKSVKQRRAAILGAEHENVLLESERYELQRLSGPVIRNTVMRFRQQYSRGPWNEKVQRKLSQEVAEIRGRFKRQVLNRGANRAFREEE